MAGSLNRVQLIGNLGQDPEVKSFQNGGRIANLRIATAEQWKDKNTGERKERTEWHTVTVQSEGLVRVVEQYLRKGSKVFVEGQLRTRKWQDRSGNDRYSTEVVLAGFGGQLIMLDGKGGSGGGPRQDDRQDSGGGSDWGSSGGGSSSGAGSTQQQRWGGGHQSDSGATGGGGWADDLDDDIPFDRRPAPSKAERWGRAGKKASRSSTWKNGDQYRPYPCSRLLASGGSGLSSTSRRCRTAVPACDGSRRLTANG